MTEPEHKPISTPATGLKVVAVNRFKEIVLFSNDTTGDVTNWIGRDGEPCQPIHAVACVALDKWNKWWSIDLSDFERASVH